MFSLPKDFVQFMRQIHGQQEADTWLERLPAILARCAENWQLKIYSPLTNLSFHVLVSAERQDGTPVVIKAFSPTQEFAHAVEALRLFKGSGMVRLLEVDVVQEVMLLERLNPGTSLAQLVPEQDQQATSILVSVMRQLWQPVPANHAFPTVEDWASGLTGLRARYNSGYGPFPPRLVDEATALFAALCSSTDTPMLLHGDLHHDNILRADQGWRAIDPKGLVGDPGYELGALFYNPVPLIFTVPNLSAILARRVDQLAEELAMDRNRVRGWALAQSVLSAWWSVENNQHAEPPRGVLACAEILSTLKR